MTSSSVARRYARALLSLGLEDGHLEAYAEELGRIERAFAASAELRDLWLNPAGARERRMAAADALAGPLALSPNVANLLRLLVERQRVGDLAEIARAYREFVDERAGRVRAVVTSAVALPAEYTQRLGSAIAALTSKRIVLETRVDPALIGGVTAQVGSMVLDGSIKTQLEQLRDTLKSARA